MKTPYGQVSTEFAQVLPAFARGKYRHIANDWSIPAHYDGKKEAGEISFTVRYPEGDFTLAKLTLLEGEECNYTLQVNWRNKAENVRARCIIHALIQPEKKVPNLHYADTAKYSTETHSYSLVWPKAVQLLITANFQKILGMVDETSGGLKVEYVKSAPVEESVPMSIAEEEKLVKEAWGLETTELAPILSDFYLLAAASHTDDAYRPQFEEVAAKAAKLISNYLSAAIGGELRHARTRPTWLKGIKKGSRKAAWGDWKKICEDMGYAEALAAAAELFRSPVWPGGSFGGPAWAKAAEILRDYYKGNYNDILLVDLTVDLQHNTGRIFNKWFTDLNYLGRILDAKLSGNKEDFALLLSHAKEARVYFLNSLESESLRREWTERFNVKDVRREILRICGVCSKELGKKELVCIDCSTCKQCGQVLTTEIKGNLVHQCSTPYPEVVRS